MANAPPPLAPLTFCGRRFSASELAMMREVVSYCSALSLTEISRTLCGLPDWKRPNGKLKNHECRLVLERLRDQGVLSSPPAALHSGRSPVRQVSSSRSL